MIPGGPMDRRESAFPFSLDQGFFLAAKPLD
jgi:hypothetical protein